MSGDTFVGKVVGAASQGAVGAVVAASLSAVTEPIVNRVLVNRVPLVQAIKELDWNKVVSFYRTTLSTNFIKFPFFETTNLLMSFVEVPPSVRGTVLGAVFCTTTLPITNYRFRKSMNYPIDLGSLYQAYLPTVFRDILYGITRNKVQTFMVGLNPQRAKTNLWLFINMFVTVIAACVISAPGNEIRGYCLQAPASRLEIRDFFKPKKFIRSTSVGALIMGFSLGIGAIATPQVEKLWNALRDYFRQNPVSYLMVVLFVLHQALENRRQKALTDKEGASKV